MKRLAVLCLLTLALCAIAMANIIPTNSSITPTGPNFTWAYQFQLSSEQNLVSGAFPVGNPVSHTNLGDAGFVTIYDFSGYVAGSCAGPTGWTCSAQLVGFTPDDVLPTDNPGIVNITWAYTSGPTVLGQPSGVDLGSTFTAVSTTNKPVLVSYTSRGIANAGPQAGTIADNVGNTQGPTGVPEPATLGLLGVGLMTLFGMIRRKVKSA
jgi:hypothetical protein